MGKDATEKGVSEVIEDTQDDEPKIIGTGHADELSRLVVLREEQFEKDSGVKLKEEEPAEEEEEKEEPAEEVAEEPEDTIEIVVDGEKKTVPLSEIKDAGIRTLQKESAADKRLEEATRANKEAQALLEQAKHTQPSVEQTDVEEEDTRSDVEDALKSMEEKQRAFTDAIQYGTDEEVKTALEEYETAQRAFYRAEMGASQATQPEAEDVVEQVASRLEERQILQKFGQPEDEGGFKDLTDDPVLYNAVSIKVDQLLESGKPNVWDTYKEAGDFVRLTYGSGRQPSTDAEPEEKPTSTTNDRIERKREIDTIPTATAKVESTTEEKPLTPSEIVEQMRSKRPGQQY